MNNDNFTNTEIAAARIAMAIENDLNYELEEEEILLLAELSKKSAVETRQRLKSLIFLERKTREEYDKTQSRNRKRLMFFILLLVAMMDEEKSSELCNYFDSIPSDGASGMGVGL
jgi:hypothetical protein